MILPRRAFLLSAPAACLLPGACSATSPPAADGRPAPAPQARGDGDFPRQPAELVRQFVGASHRDLDQVRSLLQAHPALANAAWDWGFGDFETALGAAAHTGQTAIAHLLLERGARLDIFAAAMLGHTAAVMAMIQASPGLERAPGPHGISLLAHALAGGEQARSTAQYLRSLPVGETPPASPAPDRPQRHTGLFLGEARGRSRTAQVAINRAGDLTLTFDGHSAVVLRSRRDGQTFHPAGAPHVTVEFSGSGGASTSLTVTDSSIVFVGTRRP